MTSVTAAILLFFSKICMTAAVYTESRGEPFAGQAAVALVIQNRVNDNRWPSHVCLVVTQPRQFKVVPVGPLDSAAWLRSTRVVGGVLQGRIPSKPGACDGATHFTTLSSRPVWTRSPRVKVVCTIGNHHFYQESPNVR